MSIDTSRATSCGYANRREASRARFFCMGLDVRLGWRPNREHRDVEGEAE
jgi:hypothetical protein